MKAFGFAMIFTMCFHFHGYAQFGDPEKETENLYYLAKVWGYFKYFHPLVQSCNVEWDQALLETLEKLDGASQDEYTLLIEELITKAGDIPFGDGSGRPFISGDKRLSNLDLAWFDSDYLSEDVNESLYRLYDYSQEKFHCLVDIALFFGSPQFDAEKVYEEQGSYPDKYHRTLAVFRYWNAIEYYFPYKNIMDQSWNISFTENILPIVYASTELEYHLNFIQLSTYINDSHSFFVSSVYRDWRGIELNPFLLKQVEGKTIITKVHESIEGLQVGDILISKDGVPIEEVRDSLRVYIAGSNPMSVERNINWHLEWGTGEPFTLEYESKDGMIGSIQITPSYEDYIDIRSSDDPVWRIIETECLEYGYIDMGKLVSHHIPHIVLELWETDALIFDIRNYPNGTIHEIAAHIFEESTDIAFFTTPNRRYAGVYEWNIAKMGYENDNKVYQGTIIILFNEDTQSHAEYTAMALEQFPRTVKIGSQTAGADGNIAMINVPGQITLYFTGLGVYYPDKASTQRKGIVPEIEVLPTIEGIRNGIDEVLEVALDCNNILLTSTSEQDAIFDVSLYPNPTMDQLFFDVNTSHVIDVSIFDTNGKLILAQQLSDQKQIQVKGLLSGVYIAKMQLADKTLEKKFVKL